jgi:hypothetical protein
VRILLWRLNKIAADIQEGRPYKRSSKLPGVKRPWSKQELVRLWFHEILVTVGEQLHGCLAGLYTKATGTILQKFMLGILRQDFSLDSVPTGQGIGS